MTSVDIDSRCRQRFQALFSLPNAIIRVFAPDGTLTFINDPGKRFFGLERDLTPEVLGNFNLREDPFLIKKGFVAEIENLLAGKSIHFPPLCLGTPSSSGNGPEAQRSVWVDSYGYPVLDESGALLEIVLMQFDITEKFHAEERLRESERNYRDIINTLQDAVFLHDPITGQILDVNDTMLRMFGYARDEAPNVHPADASGNVEPYTSERALERLHKAAAGEPQVFEWLSKRANGELFWTEVSLSQVTINGRSRVLALVRDISRRKETEAALHLSERRLHSLAANAPIIFFAINQAGVFTLAEGRGLEKLGLKPGEVVGRSVFDDIYQDNPVICETIRRALRGDRFSVEQTVAGRTYEIVYFPNYDWDGSFLGTMGVATDVTDRRRSEDVQRKLAAAIEQAAEAFVITDQNGTIEYVNRAFEISTGYGRDEALGQNTRMLRSGLQNSEHYRSLWSTIRSGQTWTGTFINRRKDGSLFHEKAIISGIRNETGEIISYVAAERDVTNELLLEEQLRHAQKMEAVGQLAGGVAHDFNNLLQVIQGFSHLALGELYAGHPAHQYLLDVLKASERANVLVRQLLTFSRRSPLQRREVNINELLNDLLKMLRRIIGEHLEIVIQPASDLPQISADPGKIEQAITNLCLNARDAMPAGGRLMIRTEAVQFAETDREHFAWALPGRYVCLSVTDTGSGIPPEIRDRIFEPFFTTKDIGKGTGLGLSTVYAIMQQHSGGIDLESDASHGTTFRLYFPAVGNITSPAEKSENAEKPRLERGQGVILVAEDEDLVREFAVQVLSASGYEVHAVRNGEEALLAFEKLRGKIDLALLDIVMPKLSGRQVAKRLRESRPDLPIVLCSGYDQESGTAEDTEFLAHSRSKRISKPYRVDDLLRSIQSLLQVGEVQT